VQNYPSALETQLEAGAEALGMGLSAERRALLLGYLALLGKWNKAYNLTGGRDPKAMVTYHPKDLKLLGERTLGL
jgi:16S rRNA (guanine527-N7)-methyltransferase